MAITTSKSGSEIGNSVVQAGAGSVPQVTGKKVVDAAKSVKPAGESSGKLGGMQAGPQEFIDVDGKLGGQVITKHGRQAKRKVDDDDADPRNASGEAVADQTDGVAEQAGLADGNMLLAQADTGAGTTAEATSGGGAAGAASSGAETAGAVAGGAALPTSLLVAGAVLAVGVAAASGGGGGGGGGAAAPAADTTAPAIQSMTAQGNQVVLTYNEALDAANAPVPGDFAVTVGGVANVVTGVAVAGTTVTLTLTTAVATGAAVQVSYTDPTAGNDANAIQDAAGNDAVSFTTGVVADGYIRGAQIYIDTDKDGVADAGEALAGVVTNANGNFILPAGSPAGTIIATGGVSIDTGVPNTLVLKAPAGSTIVSPLTTLVQAYVAANAGTSVADASATIVTSLGLPVGTDLTTYDPLAALADAPADATALAVQKAAVQVATVVTLAAAAPAGTTTSADAANAVINNLVTQIGTVAAPVPIDLTNAADITIVLGTASTATVGDNVTAGTIVFATSAIASAATSTAISTAQAVALDTVPPAAPAVALTAASDTGSSSTDNLTSDTTPTVRVSFNATATDGTAAVAGDAVAVYEGTTEVGVATLTPADIANGYVDVPLSALTGEGSHTFTAKISDIAAHVSAASTALDITLDTVAPTAPAVALTTDSGAADGITNVGTLDVTGTETGATVEYSIDGGATWGSTFTAAEGANSVQVRQVDAAGNASPVASVGFTLDTTAVAPTVALTTDDGASTTDRISTVGTLSVTGAETGATVQYSIDGGTTWGSTFTAAEGLNNVQVRQIDVAGNTSAAASLSFTLDNTAPTLASSTPADDAVDVVGNSIVLTFGEAVAAGTGDIVISDGPNTSNISVADTGQVAISGNTVTITPSVSPSPNTAYTVTIGAGVITDLAGNVYAGNAGNPLNFTMANNPSVAITTDDNALNSGDTATLTFTLSEASTDFTAADVTVTGGTLSNFSGSGAVYTATFAPAADSTTNATVSVSANTFTNASGLNNLAASPLTLTVDTVAPTLSSSTPADNATSFGPGNNIVLTFSENVAAGTGSIVISDGAGDTRTIAVGDAQVTISGATVTINPTADLNPSTAYNVQMAGGVITDLAGNAYAGIADATTLNFTTAAAPTITSSIDNVTNFDVTSNIVLTASENVTAVAGKYIHIVNDANDATNAGFHGEATANEQHILVTDASIVTITNNTITINPGFDLDFANNYHIMVDAGAFLGATSGQGNVATADASAMNFSTVNPSATATAADSSKMASGSDTIVSSYGWWDAEGNGVPGGASVVRDFSGGDFAIVANDLATTGIATNDFYIAVNNFGAGDLIYVDNHGDNAVQRQSDFNNGLIIDFGTAPTQVITAASGTSTGLNGGQFDVTLAGSTASFTDTAALQVLLGNVTYQPILYG